MERLQYVRVPALDVQGENGVRFGGAWMTNTERFVYEQQGWGVLKHTLTPEKMTARQAHIDKLRKDAAHAGRLKEWS